MTASGGPTGRWMAGWNTPGCLPDTAEDLPVFDTWAEAADYIHEELHERIDHEEIGAGRYSAGAMRAVGADLTEAPEGEPWGYETRGTAFWITQEIG